MKKRLAFVAMTAAITMGLVAPQTAYADPSPEEVQAQIDELAGELEAAIEDYNGARETLEETTERIEDIEEALPELEEEAAKSRELATDLAVATYTTNKASISTVSTLLDGSPTRAMERMSVLGAINAWQASDLADYGNRVIAYEEELLLLEDLKDDHKKIADDMKKEKQRLDDEMADLEELKARVEPPSYDGTLPPPPSGSAGAAVQFAYNQLGLPYQWGAAGPGAYDCSGLTMAAWNQAGVSLAHQASAQWNQTARVSRGDLAPGDLVFYNGLNHVGIYIGDGQIIHAPTSGQNVSVAGIDAMPIDGYGRPN